MIMLALPVLILSVLVVFALTEGRHVLFRIALSAGVFFVVCVFLALKFAPLIGDAPPPGSLPYLPGDFSDDPACE
ncbi:MAG: hypothetical protein IKH84_07085 [Ottowia sp.]|nr:hypothetical protein [Ottowia sp.]